MSVVRLSDDQLAELAELIADRMQGIGRATSRLVDAATLARQLGLSRAWVYEHSVELGAIRSSKRGRLRFDPERARQALGDTPSPTPPTPAPRRRRDTSRDVGSVLKVRV